MSAIILNERLLRSVPYSRLRIVDPYKFSKNGFLSHAQKPNNGFRTPFPYVFAARRLWANRPRVFNKIYVALYATTSPAVI